MERRIFPEGEDDHHEAAPYEDFRWSRFKNFAPAEMYRRWWRARLPVPAHAGRRRVDLRAPHEGCAVHDPDAGLLAKVVDMIDHVPMEDRDTKGDLYEYMLGKIATAGQNGQFRTPRHIIRLMVELVAPKPNDIICDPACGTGGFPGRGGRVPARAPSRRCCATRSSREHFHHELFHGFDFDNTMLRIGSMNMLLHGVENPDIRYRDSLAQDHAGEEEKYTLVLANPPFAGSLDYENTRQGPAADREDEEDRAAVPRALPAAAEARRPRGGHRAGRRALRLVQRAQGAATDAGRGAEARRGDLAARRRVQALRRRLHGDPALHQDHSAAPTTSGSTTWRRTAVARRQAHTRSCRDGEARPGAARSRSRADEHAKNNLPDVLARWTAARQERAQAPAHRAELLRAQGRHRGAGLRPLLNRYKEVVHEEVDAPPAERDPRRAWRSSRRRFSRG